MTQLLGGYRHDLERRAQLVATSIEFRSLVQGRYSAPTEIDPRPYHRVEDQGQQGACQGHALSSVCEHCYHIATGEPIQFSRQWCYIETQRIDKLVGRDQGSTIDGGRELASTLGVCREELWPYPGRYVTTPPDREACLQDAAQYRIRSHSVCRSYADVYEYLASGLGGVEIGISWGLEPRDGVIDRFVAGGGGHAVCFLGYSARKDSQGRNYLWLLNSWGTSWGANGWAEVAPAAVDQMARHAWTVMIGLSDLTTPKPRPVNWSTEGIY